MDARPAPSREVTYDRPEMKPIERVRELIVYVATRSAYDRAFGVTKLNKILWWSDTWAFGLHGRPITGCPYVRLPQGPVPDGIDELREQMRQRGDIAITQEDHYGRTRHKVIALRRADLRQFSGEEIAIVNAVIEQQSDRNARSVSRRSHGKMWEALPHQSRMPYESVFVSDAKPTRYDVARTKELARELGWK